MSTEFSSKGVLKIFIPNSFEKDGELIEYNEAYFLVPGENGSNDSVVKVNTKKDLREFVDEAGTLKLRLQEGKLQLVAFAT